MHYNLMLLEHESLSLDLSLSCVVIFSSLRTHTAKASFSCIVCPFVGHAVYCYLLCTVVQRSRRRGRLGKPKDNVPTHISTCANIFNAIGNSNVLAKRSERVFSIVRRIVSFTTLSPITEILSLNHKTTRFLNYWCLKNDNGGQINTIDGLSIGIRST